MFVPKDVLKNTTSSIGVIRINKNADFSVQREITIFHNDASFSETQEEHPVAYYYQFPYQISIDSGKRVDHCNTSILFVFLSPYQNLMHLQLDDVN